MRTEEFNYNLPPEFIAQEPLKIRDTSKLLVLKRENKTFQEKIFRQITEFFKEGDVLVLNNTKVIPCRLFAKRKTGARIEFFLLEEKEKGIWLALIRPSRRIKFSEELYLEDSFFKVKVLERTSQGKWLIEFCPQDIKSLIYKKGIIPTPPYIKKELKEPERYQTIFAKEEGSVASPTAGLHFTGDLLSKIKSKGVSIVYLTLHIGLATFRPIKAENIEEHKMDSEYFEISKETASLINKAKRENRRIFACGTSAVRVLETQAYVDKDGFSQVKIGKGKTNLFIYPAFGFKIVDCLITNFHTSKSTNLVLVSAFGGRDFIFKAYQYALKKRFRFYSFGDAMLIL